MGGFAIAVRAAETHEKGSPDLELTRGIRFDNFAKVIERAWLDSAISTHTGMKLRPRKA